MADERLGLETVIAYRLALTALAPLLAVALLWRVLAGRERVSDIRQRLGLTPRNADALPSTGPRLWLHGASNGELTAARPLIDALLDQNADLTLLVTCNTLTAREMARAWTLTRLHVQLAPLDYRWSLAGMLTHHKPAALIVIENELWPNRLRMVQQRSLPVALIGARLSKRSARRWGRMKGIIDLMLRGVALAAPQDRVSGERLLSLGLSPDALTEPIALKSAVALEPPAPEALAELGFAREATCFAASTHDGEEEQVLAAFATARRARPDLRLILAPRHPVRGPQVAALVEAAGFRFAARSAGEPPGDAPVYLADTLGEMPLWYASAGVCFVGGSLVPKGGHTPYEPAQFRCALLTGPHTENAADAFARLSQADAVKIVADASALGTALSELTPEEQIALGQRGAEALGIGRDREEMTALATRLSTVLGLTAPR